MRIYSPYLEGLNDDDVARLRTAELADIFKKSRTESNAIVKRVADEFRKNQTKTQLFKLWRDKTGTKTPAAWSAINRTPILSIIPKGEYDQARKTFEVLNRGTASEKEFKEALEFLNGAQFFDSLNDKREVDEAFSSILGTYRKLLTDIEKVRDSLDTLPIDAYEWDSHPRIREKICELAKAEYNAGGSDKAIAKINSMGSDELKEHLISMVKESMTLGIEIINGGE